jgi:monooxygenase
MPREETDVVIVGAGLSGVAAAYHLGVRCPRKRYVILEGRERMGGTWDLFRYPGIRSDSDMYTLGYSFRPWTEPKAIADGPAILAYVKDTARAFGIDQHIRYGQRVVHAAWSSADDRWTVSVQDASTGETKEIVCAFLFVCAGYYDYAGGYAPDFPDEGTFEGKIIHPQAWPEDLEVAGKRVVVIGSGATAVTLVPELAKRGAQVTMLQRSPTYILSAPGEDKVAGWLRDHLPEQTAYALSRWKNVGLSMALYTYCRKAPKRAGKLLVRLAKKELGPEVDAGTHFTPRYNPWDQRLCLVPDGDLFVALREGRAQVITDSIERFTKTGIHTTSGKDLPADIVVTATGLKLKFLGGITASIDGTAIEAARTLVYRGMMGSGVPNLAIAIGYTNASWTLKCELTAEYVCRLINHMDAHGYTHCVPRRGAGVQEEALINFTSGYVQRATDSMPKQGSKHPWKLYQNYALDLLTLRHAKLEDGVLEFGGAA